MNKKIGVFLISILYIFTVNISSVYANDTGINNNIIINTENEENNLNDTLSNDINISPNITTESENISVENNNSPLEISASSAVLIDASSGKVLYEKNKNKSQYPASITKIMTALLAIEYSDGDYSQKISFSDNAVFSIPPESSNIAMDSGETLTLDESLYGLLLASANEVANAIGEHFATTNENFSKIMNERAKQLGAKNTHFANASGLHDENHYTSAMDMALITKEAVTHPEFIKYISTLQHFIPPTEKQPEERPLNNSHRMIISGNPYFDARVLGGKTGYTIEAGHTLVTVAEVDGYRLISVVMGDTKDGAFTDTQTLLNYGFDNFKQVVLFEKNDIEKTISVFQTINNEKKNVGQVFLEPTISNTIVVPSNVDSENIVANFDVPSEIISPISYGDILGSITFTYENEELAKVPLASTTTINKFVPLSITDSELDKEEDILNKNEQNEEVVPAMATSPFLNNNYTIPNFFVYFEQLSLPEIVAILVGVVIALIVLVLLLLDYNKHAKFKKARRLKRKKRGTEKIRIIAREYGYKE